jgi:quercetin dioxygenase-like cupin family protein
MPKKAADSTVTTIGQKIKKVRTDKNITLENIANETGFSIDHLKKIESGKTTPPVGALLQISRALKIDSGVLLKEESSNLKDRIKAYTKRTEHYAYTTLTPGAENKHLKAFRITIDAFQEHLGVGYHHEGEEFVYVLSGKIEVTVGEHVNKLETGDSLHFNSGIQHNLRNSGESAAELIVVVYSP